MKLSQDLLKIISRSQSEPGWLADQRGAAWARFEKQPLPTVKDEEWKYTSLKDFKLGEFLFNPEPKPGLSLRSATDLPDVLKELVLSRDEEGRQAEWSGVLVQSNGATLFETISDALKAKGVILCDLKTAIQKHHDLVDPVLKEIRSASQSKFENLHQALWQGGTFIYVPEGVEIEAPVYNLVQLALPNTVIFPFTVIVVEPRARVTVIDEMVSDASPHHQFSNGYHYMSVKESAELQYVNIQRWGSPVTHFDVQLAKLKRDAMFDSVNVGLGGQLMKANIHTLLEEKGAKANLLGVFFGDQHQHFDFYTTQEHIAGETQSDLLFKSALKDHSQSSYQGIVRIPKGSQKSDAYQANKNLLLDENAKARSIPRLEIIADDVRCTHSATVGTVEDEGTFYLESRGLSHEEAVRMVVYGFFEQVIRRIPARDVRERLHRAVVKKLEGR